MESAIDIAAGDRQALVSADRQLARYGLALQPESCAVNEVLDRAGALPVPVCRVSRR
ncbi:hypothetical protein K8O61_14395 [Xanthomonas cerealis pv. cerealis]|uniref:hypothetical protein n=1 Tax=Xanthomonas cerealis TaxID=3390025 RepID=UPI001F42966A|nr:hypothetical protein [Xanthomonas translucens]UKE68661.1 hypothetical protein K8O61_14395 [Xanthomonas translucens pv. pistacia]